MKRFLVVILSLICFIATIGITGCDNNENESGVIDLADCEIGYQLPVYPSCEFDYQVSEDCIVHISSITMTLTEKNVINPNDVLNSAYYPYVFTLKATGYTDKSFAGTSIYFKYRCSVPNFLLRILSVVDDDGAITWEDDKYICEPVTFSFERLELFI